MPRSHSRQILFGLNGHILIFLLHLGLFHTPILAMANEMTESPIGIFESGGIDSTELVDLFRSGGFQVLSLRKSDLMKLPESEISMLVIPPNARYPSEARHALSEFLRDDGHLMTMSPQAFDYAPECNHPVVLSDLREGGRDYRLTSPNRPGRTVEWVNMPSGGQAVQVYAPHLGAGNFLFDIPINPRSEDRSVLCFSAKGDYNVDILYLQLVDLDGETWLSFVELDRDWRSYNVSMADFLPRNPDLLAQGALVDPANVARLTIGMATWLIWHERDGGFALGPVSLGSRAAEDAYVPTSELMKWRIQFERYSVKFPEWVIDPFLGTEPISDAHALKAVDAFGQTDDLEAHSLGGLWTAPPPLGERGREPTELLDVLRQRHDIKRVPLMHAVDESGQILGTVAEIRTANSGFYRGSSVAIFGLDNVVYRGDTDLGKIVLDAARYILESPRLQRITVKSQRTFIDPLQLTLDLLITNPTNRKIDGQLIISVAEGMLRAEVPVTLHPKTTDTFATRIGQIPSSFPLHDFTWEVQLNTDSGNDRASDRVRAEELLIVSAKHMLNMQKEHKDGRMSHHFFADIYAARALYALGLYLKDPDVSGRNELVLNGLTGDDFIRAALCFTDGVVARQRGDGAFPMGYGEHRDIIYIADLGSIALGLVQMASWLDEPRSSKYLDAVGRYFDLRETFYISDEKAKKLEAEFGVDSRGVIRGTYGLGFLGSDYFTGESWPATRREERGPAWVLPISMGFSGGMSLLEQGSKFEDVALRDTVEFLESKYSADGYFASEGLFWLYYSQNDPDLRAKMLRLFELTALSPIMTTRDHDWYEVGGRASLRWLAPMYYRNFIKDTPDLRTATVKALWEMGSSSSGFSISEMTSRFPRTIYGPSIDAYRAAAYTAIWLIEMLDPGSTLLKDIQVPKP